MVADVNRSRHRAYKRHRTFLPARHQVLCTLQRAMWYFQEHNERSVPADFKLATLCQYFGVDFHAARAHEAFADVSATVDLYRTLGQNGTSGFVDQTTRLEEPQLDGSITARRARPQPPLRMVGLSLSSPAKILSSALWGSGEILPAAEVRSWIDEQHERAIRVSLVRESAIGGEADLLCDFGIYGDRATGIQELDEQSRTLRFILLFDKQSIKLAQDRWARLSLYASPYADLLALKRRQEHQSRTVHQRGIKQVA